MTYRVTGWNELYEKAQTRKCREMKWVAVPNKLHGSGYRRVAAHERAVEIFAAWILILQVASKMPTRGLLYKDGRSLTDEDLSFMTGYPKEIFTLAFTILTSREIGWLERVAGDEIVPSEPQKTGSGSGLVVQW
jgi:hypothetical protein